MHRSEADPARVNARRKPPPIGSDAVCRALGSGPERGRCGVSSGVALVEKARPGRAEDFGGALDPDQLDGPSTPLRGAGSKPNGVTAPAAIPALRLAGLCKAFTAPAVDNLDLTVRAGELYALLGPNGAGKTTTLRMIAGLLPPDAGSISIFGIDALADPVAAKRITAWLPDEPMLYDKLTPIEYLEFVAGLWGVERGARRAPMPRRCSTRSSSPRTPSRAARASRAA